MSVWLARLAKLDGQIAPSPGSCAVYARGDRRCRPVGFVSRQVFDDFRRDGVVEITPKRMWRLSARGHDVVAGRVDLRAETEDRACTIDGAVRMASFRISALRRLARDLTAAQIEAGERFARDHALAQSGEMATQVFGEPRGSGPRAGERAEAGLAHRIDARREYNLAADALGPGLLAPVRSLCAFDTALSAIEREQGWRPGTGLAVLRIALDRLASHYGTVVGI